MGLGRRLRLPTWGPRADLNLLGGWSFLTKPETYSPRDIYSLTMRVGVACILNQWCGAERK